MAPHVEQGPLAQPSKPTDTPDAALSQLSVDDGKDNVKPQDKTEDTSTPREDGETKGKGNEEPSVNGEPKVNEEHDNEAGDSSSRQEDNDTKGKGKGKEKTTNGNDDRALPAPWRPGADGQEDGDGDGDGDRDGSHHGSDGIKEKVTHKKQKVKDKTKPSGGFDDTPLPDFPPGFTLKFTFHKASNLPAADLTNVSADPYLHTTLTANIPKRHKEDPDLTHRTKTIRSTLEPEWEEEWIVANVPKSGFHLKCRLYDEDYANHDDRLGNMTFESGPIDEKWKGISKRTFEVKKRSGSKRAYIAKAVCTAFQHKSMTPLLEMSVELLERSEGPGAQMCTLGPSRFVKHFSPMMGRLTGIKVNKDEEHDGQNQQPQDKKEERETKKYDFQAIEFQLKGPVPPKLYHRYVEFRPLIGLMFTSSGLRGRLMSKALHKQHNRIYNFDSSTEWGDFKPCSKDAALQFLKLAHFDEGGRVFTYVLTLDGLLRFTETGKEFGIDLLSKHTMHSDVATYIACSGEFFIRRLEKPNADEDPEPDQETHPNDDIPGGPPHDKPPKDPSYYQLVIDNDSGTYRPDKSILPDLKEFLEKQFPGLGIVTMHCADDELSKLKDAQMKAKKKEGQTVNMVLNRSPSSSSFSSSDESRLGDLEANADGPAKRSKKERAWDVVEDPHRWKDVKNEVLGHGKKEGESSGQAK